MKRMSKFLIFGFILMPFLTVKKAQAIQSFNELGRSSVLLHFSAVKNDLESFSKSTDWKSTKKLRKDIGNLKLLLDVFVHAYPKKGLGKKDSWEYVREELDDGYEVFGNYKDVYDTSQTTGEEIDSSEKSELYEVANEWKNDFLKKVETQNFFAYLEQVNEELTKRKRKDLPKYLWRRLNFSPLADYSGTENLQLLIEGLLELGSDDLKDLFKIKNLTKYENEETFHDWRKGLRNVLKLNAFFPEISVLLKDSFLEVATLEVAIDKFGDLNDLLVVYHKKDSSKLKKEINDQWSQLKEWLEAQEMKQVLKTLKKSISL